MLNFFFNFRLNNDKYSDVILTYKNIDKKTFFTIPSNFKSIDDIIKELDMPNELKWPCSIEKEVNKCLCSLLNYFDEIYFVLLIKFFS